MYDMTGLVNLCFAFIRNLTESQEPQYVRFFHQFSVLLGFTFRITNITNSKIFLKIKNQPSLLFNPLTPIKACKFPSSFQG
jgi:hypothetical protein